MPRCRSMLRRQALGSLVDRYVGRYEKRSSSYLSIAGGVRGARRELAPDLGALLSHCSKA